MTAASTLDLMTVALLAAAAVTTMAALVWAAFAPEDVDAAPDDTDGEFQVW